MKYHRCGRPVYCSISTTVINIDFVSQRKFKILKLKLKAEKKQVML